MDAKTYSAFVGSSQVASGALGEVLPVLKQRFEQDRGAVVLIFDDQTGKQVDFDLRGTLDRILARYAPPPVHTGPGRPKLGVVAREISLLPRHWEWLEQQPSGASAAIRRLVEEARKLDPNRQEAQQRIEAAGRFLSAIAGNLPGYEEASRALYARDRASLDRQIRSWPRDIRRHALKLVEGVI